jgi:hypothetical protein
LTYLPMLKEEKYFAMKNLPFLSILLVLVLVLAACGPADTEPGIGTPDAFTTPSDPINTPVVPVDPATTPELTPEATEDVVPPATPQATPTDLEETPVVGETADESPRRASNMLDYDIRNYEDETIGSVEELIISLDRSPAQTIQPANDEQQQEANPQLAIGDGEQISYVVVNMGGFLGIGQRQVAIPFESLQLQTGEDEGDYAFYIAISEEELESLPEVDLDQIDFTNLDWDVNLRSLRDAETPEAGELTPTPEAESTPVPAGTPDETEQAGVHIYALRVSVLLGSEVYDQTAVAPGQTVEITPTPDAVGTPTADVEDTPTTAGTVLDRETVVATVEDLIIDPDSGNIEYVILDVDDNLEMGERWIPVPLQALNILGADDLLLGMGIEYLVKVDRQQLAEAPSFEVGTLPVDEDPDWDTGVRQYWGTQ